MWNSVCKAVVPFLPPILRINVKTLDELPTLNQIWSFIRTLIGSLSVKFVFKSIIWIMLLRISFKYDSTLLFTILSAFYLVFTNLGDTANGTTLSPYSVFNPRGQRMMGSLSADQFENEIRHRLPGHSMDSDDDESNFGHDDEMDELLSQDERNLQTAIRLSLLDQENNKTR